MSTAIKATEQSANLDPSFAGLNAFALKTPSVDSYIRGKKVPKFIAKDLEESFEKQIARIFSYATGFSSANISRNDKQYLIHDISILRDHENYFASLFFINKDGKSLKIKTDLKSNKLMINGTEVRADILGFDNLLVNINALNSILQKIISFDEANGSAKARLEAPDVTSTARESEVRNNFLPVSDRLGVWRNFIGLCSAVLALISPIGPMGLTIGFCILGAIIIAIHLHAYIKLSAAYSDSQKEILRLVLVSLLLSALGIASSILLGTSADKLGDTITTIFGILVVVQALCFIRQGYSGFVAQANRWEIVAKETHDSELAGTAAYKKFSGRMSVFEGSLWLVLGLARTALGVALLFLGQVDPAVIDKLKLVINCLTSVLFDIIFSISYISMIITGKRDEARHTQFLNDLLEARDYDMTKYYDTTKDGRKFKAQSLYKQLQFLKGRLTTTSDKAKNDKELLKQELIKNKNSLAESTYYDDTCIEMFNKLDVFIEALKKAIKNMDMDEVETASENIRTLKVVDYFIEDLISAVKRNIDVDKWSVKLGYIGLFGGLLVNHGIPLIGGSLAEPGFFDEHGIISGSMNFSSLSSDPELWGNISGVADCLLWMWVNHLFEEKLDAPNGRTTEEEARLKEIRSFLNKDLVLDSSADGDEAGKPSKKAKAS